MANLEPGAPGYIDHTELIGSLGIRPGMRVLFVGRDTGKVVYMARRQAGPDGYVLAIEPNRQNYLQAVHYNEFALPSLPCRWKIKHADLFEDDYIEEHKMFDLVICANIIQTFNNEQARANVLTMFIGHVLPGGRFFADVSDCLGATLGTLHAYPRGQIGRRVNWRLFHNDDVETCRNALARTAALAGLDVLEEVTVPSNASTLVDRSRTIEDAANASWAGAGLVTGLGGRAWAPADRTGAMTAQFRADVKHKWAGEEEARLIAMDWEVSFTMLTVGAFLARR